MGHTGAGKAILRRWYVHRAQDSEEFDANSGATTAVKRKPVGADGVARPATAVNSSQRSDGFSPRCPRS